MKEKFILLNRVRGRKGKPLPPGHYSGVIKNAVYDELSGIMVTQFEVTEQVDDAQRDSYDSNGNYIDD